MKGYIINAEKKRTALPELYSYSVKHGMGLPCDAFELSCGYLPELRDKLSEACFFAGLYGGGVVFAGVIDEYEISCGAYGRTLSVSGRGMAARLLDNEAEPAVYEYCTLPALLRSLVVPLGLTDIEWRDIGCCPGYTVESGTSCWKALSDFTRYTGGITPRFSREGTLILTGKRGAERTLDAGRISECTFRERRYGVISEATARKYDGSASGTVKNEAFIARGGSAKRVITLPRETRYDFARYTGEYQIHASMEDCVSCTVTVQERFAAFPGDVASLTLPELGISGRFNVTETETWADASGCGTRIKMTPGGDA